LRSERTSVAALGVALALLWLALPPAPRAPRPVTEPPRSGAARLLFGLPLDLNRADPRDLEVLPGIGPARARAIVAARPFCRAADLARVPGIGPATLRRLAGRVSAPAPVQNCGD
jgi:competence protein ComEA